MKGKSKYLQYAAGGVKLRNLYLFKKANLITIQANMQQMIGIDHRT